MDEGSIPVEHFFQNPVETGFQISPNGKYISYLSPYENRLNIHVKNRETGDVKRITDSEHRDIMAYFWANNDRLVYLNDRGGDENYRIYAVNKDGSNQRDLTPFEDVRAQIIDELEDIEDEMIIGLNKNNPQLHEPYRLNIVTGDLEQLAENTDMFNPIMGWLTDHDGKIRVALKIEGGVNTTLLYRETEEDEFQSVKTVPFTESISPLFFTFDNKNVYALSNLNRDKTAVVKMDIRTGEEIEEIYKNPDFDVSGLNYSRKRKVLTTVSFTSWKRERYVIDNEMKDVIKRLDREFDGYEYGITSSTKDENMMVVRTYSDRSLGSFYLYDRKADTFEFLAEVNPELNEEEMAEMKPVTYQSRDGLTIHGYLTLPVGKEAENLPVVVNVHGGPWARDNWGFNPEVQLLANRGYAVFQMNFRGSTGYGKEFWMSSFKQWGQTMQDDVTDGVKWLIDEGIADPDRIAIYGASYGGYAALAGLTLTPELYACGISYVGVSNLFTFLKTIPPYWEPLLDMMHEMVGHPEKDSIMFRENSPFYQVDNIQAPLFVAQGAKDPRVNKAESDQIVNALRERNISVPYLVKENEGHGFLNEENRFEFYKAMSGFLRMHLQKDEI
ncbi:MAG: S9 family peptidase [Chitinophagaceae bacterium]|nr:MAG: S9 family peptidase [Chitinophagaceae bacterium]